MTKDFLLNLVYRWAYNKVADTWSKSKPKAILFSLGFAFLYLACLVTVISLLSFAKQTYPMLSDSYHLYQEDAVIVATPQMVENNNSEDLERYEFKVYSNLNQAVTFITDINVFPDNEHTIINPVSSDVLLPKGSQLITKPYTFSVKYKGRNKYSIEVLIRCGETQSLCGRGTLR